MTDDKTGGPAFPSSARVMERLGNVVIPEQITEGGMTLRDWFAGQALAGLIAQSDYAESAGEFARQAYVTADAMLAERSK